SVTCSSDLLPPELMNPVEPAAGRPMLAVPATNLSRSRAISSLRRAPRPALLRASILKGLRRQMLPVGALPTQPAVPCKMCHKKGPKLPQRVDDLLRAADASHARKDAVHWGPMRFSTDAGHRVFRKHQFVIAVKGGTSGRLDADVG